MEDTVNQCDFLSKSDIQCIEESIKECENNQLTFNNKYPSLNTREGFPVKGKVSMFFQEKWIDNFPKNKKDAALHLAIVLEDEESIGYYKKLTRERRLDFLKRCLEITYNAAKNNQIKTTNAKYFSGTVRNRTKEQERIEAYKRKHYYNKR